MGSRGVAQAAVSHWCRSKKGASASPAHRRTPPYLGVRSGARSMGVGGAGAGGAAEVSIPPYFGASSAFAGAAAMRTTPKAAAQNPVVNACLLFG